MNRTSTLSLLAAAAALSVLIPGTQAATITQQTYSGSFPATISGTLANQNTVLEETFTLLAPNNLTIATTSYATGGFEPNLMLYNSAGQSVATGVIPGTSPLATKDPTTMNAFDAYLTVANLTAGSYTLALMDFEVGQSLTATNLSDGFNLNFGSGTTFVDEMGNARSGAYRLTISPAAVSATPEPGTLLLATPLLLGLAVRAKKARRNA